MSHNAWHNARAMYERDACAQAMGMDIIDMGEGYAVVLELDAAPSPGTLVSTTHRAPGIPESRDDPGQLILSGTHFQ